MIYEFVCEPCNTSFDVIRVVDDYDKPAQCPECKQAARRVPFPRKLFLNQTKVQEKYFSHALGEVVTDSSAKRIAKERGLIEVGNEKINMKPAEVSYDEVWKGV